MIRTLALYPSGNGWHLGGWFNIAFLKVSTGNLRCSFNFAMYSLSFRSTGSLQLRGMVEIKPVFQQPYAVSEYLEKASNTNPEP